MQAASRLRWEDKKIKNMARRESEQQRVFGHRPTGVSVTWQRRYEGVAKNGAFDLFVAFFHGLRKKKKQEEGRWKKVVCNRKSCERRKVTVSGQSDEKRGCLVLLRSL